MRTLQLAGRDEYALGQLFGEMVDIMMVLANRTVVAERGRARAPRYHSFPRLHPQHQTLLRQALGLRSLEVVLWMRRNNLLRLNWGDCIPGSKIPHRRHCSCTAKSILREIFPIWPVGMDVRISESRWSGSRVILNSARNPRTKIPRRNSHNAHYPTRGILLHVLCSSRRPSEAFHHT